MVSIIPFILHKIKPPKEGGGSAPSGAVSVLPTAPLGKAGITRVRAPARRRRRRLGRAAPAAPAESRPGCRAFVHGGCTAA